MLSKQPKSNDSTASHANNFGLLRLLCASFVVVSHSTEMTDGNPSHELLARYFGTTTLGIASVIGFFLISGYLITKSFAERPNGRDYLIKRCARIVPGFLVNYWVCILAVAPFAGSPLSFRQILSLGFRFTYDIPGVFHALPFPYLNGSVWTIRYEIICYLVVYLIGRQLFRLKFSALRIRWHLLFCVIAGLIFNGIGIARNIQSIHNRFDLFLGFPRVGFILLSSFGVGALYYFFRDRIVYTHRGAIAASILLFALFFNPYLAEDAVAILGGYLVFWFALKCGTARISVLASKNDISYGMYLYAWPIQSLLIWNFRGIHPWVLCILSLAGSGLAGYASWHLIEKRVLKLAHRGRSSAIKPGESSPQKLLTA